MRDSLFRLPDKPGMSIQERIREMMVSAILDQRMQVGEPLPSCRALARSLKVSRNTVVLAYQGLTEDGFILSRQRSGFYVNPEVVIGPPPVDPAPRPATPTAPDWGGRFRVRPGGQPNIEKPENWQSFPYPFVYGQTDPALFPIAAWRECTRQALGLKGMGQWTADSVLADDPDLVEQIRTRLLSRRGIWVGADEILVTLGAQNALYLIASLLVTERTTVALEDPGYPDVRNIFALKTDRLVPIPVDEEGLPIDARLDGCDLVFVTPSHQSPTTVTMPASRREALLQRAADRDMIVIEDDYEAETNYLGQPTPALKSMDRDGRVIYIGSLSKTLFHGLRLGYLVGPAPLIAEARALRRLMMRHPPNNNQRTTALFLSLGHHDALVRRLHRVYRARWQAMTDALSRFLPDSARAPNFGGTSFWVRGPDGLDARALAARALEEGVVIEPGDIHFAAAGDRPESTTGDRPEPTSGDRPESTTGDRPESTTGGRPGSTAGDAPGNFFRLGFSAIPEERIEPGIRLLAGLINRDRRGRP